MRHRNAAIMLLHDTFRVLFSAVDFHVVPLNNGDSKKLNQLIGHYILLSSCRGTAEIIRVQGVYYCTSMSASTAIEALSESWNLRNAMPLYQFSLTFRIKRIVGDRNV